MPEEAVKYGVEVDLLIDSGTKLMPVEIKSGQTLNRDFFSGVSLNSGDSFFVGYLLRRDFGTWNRNRTGTPLRTQDFKSWASTNSAIQAQNSICHSWRQQSESKQMQV